MKKKRIFGGILVWFLPLFCFAGGAGGIKTPEAPQEEETVITAEGVEMDLVIRTWVGEKPRQPEEGEEIEIDSFEDVQNYLFGNSGHIEEYMGREALLTEFGFADSEPLYRSFEEDGSLRLELYVDEDREQACGIFYSSRLNDDWESVIVMKGFTICSFPETEWKGDPFAFRSVYGTTGEEMEDVKDYEERIEYTDSGRPKRFVSRGRVEGWSAEDMMQDILRIEFTYREDDTLFYREYYHSHQAFSTTLRNLDSYYDEHERVIYENGYITHGCLEYYYIYADREGDVAQEPTYVLEIDHNAGVCIANLVKCR